MNQNDLSPSARCAGFLLERVQPVPELRTTAYVFTHEKTGARLLHLYNDDPNNLFSIAFCTPVSDSTGVPHILEHSVLGGSRAFPLKDPFQELLKGSLQTFLNALTYPDKTVYPVSSQVEADFFNLVNVYCDAVFHPLLTSATFRQEGWHFELESEDAVVGIKGIVYNEMKGVFSDFASHVERKAVSLLFPDTSYSFESGGEPQHITDLTFEQFKSFHARFYHPSNSYIILYGNIPSEKTLRFLNEKYLVSFDRLQHRAEVVPQPDWASPRRAEVDAPAPEQDDGLATVALAWKFGMSADPATSLLGRVLYRYLMGTESGPLRRVLVDSGLGEDLDDICGFSNELVHGMFCVGLRKSRPERADAIESLVLSTLEKQATGAIDERLLEGALRQTEFRLREVADAGRFPYNLQLAERCLRSWLYNGDPLAHLAFEKPLAALRAEKDKGCGWFAGKIGAMLVHNPHRLRITVRASSSLGKQLETQSAEQAASLSSAFTKSDRLRIVKETRTLIEGQKKPSPPEALAALPKLAKSDLPPKNRAVQATLTRVGGAEAHLHPIFTSGIVYCDIGFNCTAVPAELLPYLPLYLELLTRCGAAGLSYEQMAKRVSLSTGGIHGSFMCDTAVDTENVALLSFVHAKSLASRFGETAGILRDIFLEPDFSNMKQVKDVLLEMRNNLNASVIDSGNTFAVLRASANIAAPSRIDEILAGITQLRFLDGLARADSPKDVAATLQKVHAAVVSSLGCRLSMTADDPETAAPAIASVISALPRKKTAEQKRDFQVITDSAGIEISSSVNFAAKSWALGKLPPEQSGVFLLLSRNLSTGYLWDKVRVEGGAYGGAAMVSGGEPVFSCASYRDPNLASTFSHFEKGLAEAAAGLPAAAIDQSIIGTIGRIDAPRTPHEKGFAETAALVYGRTREYRQRVRDGVLAASPATVAGAAQLVLASPRFAVAALGSSAAFDIAEKEGIRLKREPLL
ncbi:MAG TPA: insulinase family protein [Chitinivibrionales bacterium]|jgi:Zn-dependent M16 (insulinase) family peptidase|nr:insulinase family protein [Chitinivibrionales bacterium]